MFFRRYYLGCLAHASYLIGDEETKVAAVVDPQRDIDQYLQDASDQGFEIRYVLLTHFHADFVSGHIELRDRTGAKIYLGARAQPEYEFTPLSDGDVIEFGKTRLSILETPGHTPESISILVYDLAANDRKPHAVMTGDTLFVGDVGRPDLLASIGVTADELSGMLYDSLHDKLMKLDDDVLVYPAHGAGSLCGKTLGDAAYSTIGEQRKYNYALQPMSRAEFQRIVTSEQPDAPDYFAHDAVLNRQERASLGDAMLQSFKPLSVAEVKSLVADGTQVVDTRDPIDFAAAHLTGSINISLDGKYAQWAGSVLNNAVPIVVVAESGREKESIMRLGRIGFDQVKGFLADGAAALEQHDDMSMTTPRITAKALAEQLRSDKAPFVLDVRTDAEWSQGHIPGSHHIPLSRLRGLARELPDEAIVVYCRTGYRSSVAASILQLEGNSRVSDLVGGKEAWDASQLPTETASVEV